MGAPGNNIALWQDWGSETDKEEEEFAKKDGRSDYLKFPDNGKVQVRVVPPPRGSGLKSPFVMTYQHYIEFIPKNQAATAKFNCPKKMANKRCPACEKKQQLLNSGLAFDNPKVSMFAAKKRVFAVVLNRAEDGASPLIWAFGAKVFKQLRGHKEDVGDFTNPVTGRDLRVKKTGKGFDTDYHVGLTDVCPLLEDAKEMAALAEAYPAKNIAKEGEVPTYDECVTAIKEAMGAARGDNDDERPARSNGKTKASNDGWGDDEDETPRRGSKKAKPQDDDDGWGSDAIDTEGETVGDAPFDDGDDDIPF